jgi:nucleotide-binding universal stress UspA family protein
MFRKMLVCTDLSPASDALIQCVEELKNIGLEEVILTHVTFLSTTPRTAEFLTEETSPTLQRQKEFLEERGIGVSVEMPCGLPARAIAETAEQHDVSAILIGSHGKGILQSALLGSVSAQLLHETRRPVLLARISLLEGGACATVCSRMFAKGL